MPQTSTVRHPVARLAHDETGSGLIEVLVTVTILGLVFVAVLVGMATSIKLSNYHRLRAQAAAVSVNAAERLKEAPKVACASETQDGYVAAAGSAATARGWDASRVQITSVRYWDGDAYGTTCYDNPTNKLPLQQITVTVSHPQGSVVQTLTFVKGVG